MDNDPNNADHLIGNLNVEVTLKSSNGVVLSDFSRAILTLNIDKTIADTADSLDVKETLVTDMDFWVSHSRPTWDTAFTSDPFCDSYDFVKTGPNINDDPTTVDYNFVFGAANSFIIESLYPERFRGRVTPNLEVELTLSPADKELYKSGLFFFSTKYN